MEWDYQCGFKHIRSTTDDGEVLGVQPCPTSGIHRFEACVWFNLKGQTVEGDGWSVFLTKSHKNAENKCWGSQNNIRVGTQYTELSEINRSLKKDDALPSMLFNIIILLYPRYFAQ